MKKACVNCGGSFEITDDDLVFYDRVSPVFDGKKHLIPPPTLCPMCRLRRRLVFRNHNYVYLRPSSTTGKTIFSMWDDDAPFPVIENDEWWGDSWDPMDYGRDYDFDRPFFEQFEELRNAVPQLALDTLRMENSDYCNNSSGCKNCYLVFNTNDAESCMACEHAWYSKDCIDCTRTVYSELCYDCIECANCYNVQSSGFCDNCGDSVFLLNCRSCRNCFGCVNLRQGQYCIFNEKKSREEYEKYVKDIDIGSYKARGEWADKAGMFWKRHPRPHRFVRLAEDVSGDNIVEAKDVYDSFFIRDGEHLKHCLMLSGQVRDCRDVSLFGVHIEQSYESAVCGLDSINVRFCYSSWEGVEDLLYCWLCSTGCSHCFGCVGLRRKRHCILNKQYSKEEYEDLVPRIIEHMTATGEWGEFFPMRMTPVAYNHSLAQRYFLLTKQEVEARRLRWYEKEDVEASGAIETSKLPDGLPESNDSIIVKSALSGTPFKITSQEIKRYRQFRIPLPRLTYDERLDERARRLGGIKLYKRTCAKTGKPILTTYSPESPWIIWDREVYEREFGS